MKLRIHQAGIAPIILIISIALGTAVVGFTTYAVISGRNNDNQEVSREDAIEPDMDGSQTDAADTTTADGTLSPDTTTASDASVSTTNSTSGSTPTSPSSGSSSVPASSGNTGSSAPTPQTKSFNIDAFSFGYSMSTISVNPGDVVTLTFTNSGGKHDWVVDEIAGAQTAIINGGQSDTITFTVPQSAAGKTYTFYCSVGNHRALGMTGNFVVGT